MRGGGGAGIASRTAGPTSVTQAENARASSADLLARTTRAIQAVKAMQDSAQALSSGNRVLLPPVGNGLGVGALQVAPLVPKDLSNPKPGEISGLWTGAQLPTQSAANGLATVSITQTSQQAVLNWKTFNVGRFTELSFDQSAAGSNVGQWVVFNKINDPSGNPSQILGSIKAQGQVYVINQNGIIFGAGCQVNTHALVASSLPINDSLISRGLLNNPDAQFLFSALPVAAGKNGTPAFAPPPANTPDGNCGDVIVQAGASISCPTNSSNAGGRVTLVGPNVINQGQLSTPDGQTILAAGLQVGFDAHSSSDASLRGLDVFVGAVTKSSSAASFGTVTNSGWIDSPRGSIAVAGRAINQLGALTSTTSVSLNGRIDLMADYNALSNPAYDPVNYPGTPPFLFQSTGVVTLGTGSVLRILPETSDPSKVVMSQWAVSSRSEINIRGLAIHCGSNSTILAPSANVRMDAGEWNYLPSTTLPTSAFIYSSGQVYLDPGAAISVAGTQDVAASVLDNIIAVQLRGAELANSPVQRNGILRGKTVYVDITRSGSYAGQAWVGTPLADLAGYVDLIKYGIGRLTTPGGTVTLTAGGSVVMQRGSSIDVSGGWINYQGGIIQTTRLISGGHIYDISQATPDLVYDGIYAGFTQAHARWNISRTYVNQLVAGARNQAGYIEGAPAGSIIVTAPVMVLDGELSGGAIVGPRQRTETMLAGSLSLTFDKQDRVTTYQISPTPPDVVFQSGASQAACGEFALDSSGNPEQPMPDRAEKVVLSPELLTKMGFGNLSVDNGDGKIEVPAGVALTTAPSGSITLTAANIEVGGKLAAPAGTLKLTAYDYSPYAFFALQSSPNPTSPLPDASRGSFVLKSGGELSAAGMVVNDRNGISGSDGAQIGINGGSIAISGYDVTLDSGSKIDVSGGVQLFNTGKSTYGNGGSILINSGRDPEVKALLGGHLSLRATLIGIAGLGAKGGALSIQAPLVQVGGVASDSETLLLSPDFFSEGGFSSFTLTGLGLPSSQATPAVRIVEGTEIIPKAKAWLAMADATDVSEKIVTLPEGVRSPVSVTFNAPGVADDFTKVLVVRGDIVMEAGASVRTDAKAGVSFNGQTVALLGTVVAPGGSITISGGSDSSALFADQDHALATVDLGPQCVLSTAGKVVLIPDARGYRTGFVTSGGAISISGNIVAEAGSVLDVSGAGGTLDLPLGSSDAAVRANGSLKGEVYAPTRVETDGGSITLAGKQMLFADTVLRGGPGGSGAMGGSLSVSSGIFISPVSGITQTPKDVTLDIKQSGLTIPAGFRFSGQAVIGRPVAGGDGQILDGHGYFVADRFNGSGLASLSLGGVVRFSGDVSVDAVNSIAAGSGGIIYGDGKILLSAPYVAVGTPFQTPQLSSEIQSPFQYQNAAYPVPPTHGSGSLVIDAGLVDIGYLSLQNIGLASFNAAGGDIRGNGELAVAGDIQLTAAQIYPATATSFTIAAYDYSAGGATAGGTVTISKSGSGGLPLSAGGKLSIYGSVIYQGGVLRAPMGSITIGWAGDGTGPSDLITGQTYPVTRQVTLGGGSMTSVSAVDPATGVGLNIPYGINLNGTSWIDPTGTDITQTGPTAKSIRISATNIIDQGGSTIDLRGGGDLLAYRWVSGTGGSHDILNSTSSFAIIPGFSSDFSPYAWFNNSPNVASSFGSDAGYGNASLGVGDRIYLGGGGGVASGTYTLLPARYALLPGAFLVTPMSGAAVGTVALTDGASLFSGSRVSGLGAYPGARLPLSRFEVASSKVINSRAEYDISYANDFLAKTTQDVGGSWLPRDSGRMVLFASRMTLDGTVLAAPATGGRGAIVDIASTSDILINASGKDDAFSGLVLGASQLNSLGAESLLIGGVRDVGTSSTTVSVKTGRLTLDNAGCPLTGQDIILVANQSLTLDANAEIRGTGSLSGAVETLSIGQETLSGSGNGLLVRVSGGDSSQVTRAGVSSSTVPTLTIGAGVRLSGANLVLDSTADFHIDPAAVFACDTATIRGGKISIQLDNPGTQTPSGGLVLSGQAWESLQAGTRSLCLGSYSSFDIYGTGRIGMLDASGTPIISNLEIEAGEIRGFNTSGREVVISAASVVLGNGLGGVGAGSASSAGGTLRVNSDTITLGAGDLAIDQFSTVVLSASRGIAFNGQGALQSQGDVRIVAPVVNGATGASESISSAGRLDVLGVAGAVASVTDGLGATLSLVGTSVSMSSNVVLPGGAVSVRATSGDITIGGEIDVSGAIRHFFDVTTYTGGGQVSLQADSGSVSVLAGGVLNVAGGGSNAGSVNIAVPSGMFALSGTMLGQGGSGGTFALDVGSLAGESCAALDSALNCGGFSKSRDYRVRKGNANVDGFAKVSSYNLTADNGSIIVTGTIDASGAQGGAISLEALGNVTLLGGALLSVKGTDFNSAGKGGTISLETRGQGGTGIDIRNGATLDLSVVNPASQGESSGTLHLRAPQNAAGSDLLVGPINGSIRGASDIVVEGFKTYLAPNGSVDAVEASILDNGNSFLGPAGSAAAGYSAMWNRILGGQQPDVTGIARIEVGAEIVNPSGNLTLAQTWDLSPYRFGPESAPGVLTMRASGNVVFSFRASLSDGFDTSAASLWQAPLLPAGALSWSYRVVSGADTGSANVRRLQPLSGLGSGLGSVLIGLGSPALPISANSSRQSIIPGYYQTIRTGSGDIDIVAGRDVQLLNPITTIYTAGIQADSLDGFDLPNLNYQSTSLGATQAPIYPAQYSYGGGNVSISAQNDIARYQIYGSGQSAQINPYSTRELPTNWLYRRGYVDPATGQFAATHSGGEIESTSWWVDFSNFFEDVGALGGGNVSLTAGHDVSNVDAVVPTNARMLKGVPSLGSMAELGGGDLAVRAGHDINGGVYYVERGKGSLSAGNSILTNSTRAALTQSEISDLKAKGLTADASTWLPTTLFLGKGSFDVTAGDDVLLGPVTNPFLLPQGINNSFYEKSYFSTCASSDAVNISSLTGSVTLRNGVSGGDGSLYNWYKNVLLYYGNTQGAAPFSVSQPWLRLAETSADPFEGVAALMPGTIRAVSYSGDVNVIGDLLLSPSSSGTLDLMALGSINGLQPQRLAAGGDSMEWGYATINLSDADPNRIPGIATPLSLPSPASGYRGGIWNFTSATLMSGIDLLFAESGSSGGVYGVLQTKQALHAPGVLHKGDSVPVHLYAESGDISGMTLFSGKATRVVAGRDISDIALYIQNAGADDVSVAASGGNIVAYDPDSRLRTLAQTPGNALTIAGVPVDPLAGDIQISGPGTLEVLAGGNLDLGVGSNRSDGTGAGILSIGNQRNPYLPYTGADIIAIAGIGSAWQLDSSSINFEGFIQKYLSPAASGDGWAAFQRLSKEAQDTLALEVFFDILRDTGRSYNDPQSPGSRSYERGFDAISTLFPGAAWRGDIALTSREIKTVNGGNVMLLAPGGRLTVGFDLSGNQPLDQGILTEGGGNISIFTSGSVIVGTSRIFTLRGGNEVIWSSFGDIAAGASAKTVQAAPPTQVIVDPQSADVRTDLAGLATGGGIGVLQTVVGAKPGDVDLIAPAGVIDAGDAGIRASGNLNLAARMVINADNIEAGGSIAGAPTIPVVSFDGGLIYAGTRSNVAADTASDLMRQVFVPTEPTEIQLPSIITVEVLQYGDDESDED